LDSILRRDQVRQIAGGEEPRSLSPGREER
jgi:hypothetical protein